MQRFSSVAEKVTVFKNIDLLANINANIIINLISVMKAHKLNYKNFKLRNSLQYYIRDLYIFMMLELFRN